MSSGGLMPVHGTIEQVDMATGHRYGLRPEAIRLSSCDLWGGIRLEHRYDKPGEISEAYFLRHVIAFYQSASFNCDIYRLGHGWTSKDIPKGTIQLWPAGMPFALRWSCCVEALLLEISADLIVTATNRRLELRPFEIKDGFISQAMLALEDDIRAGSRVGRLYGESLGAAIAAHLVRISSDVERFPDERARVSSTVLGQVLEYVRENLRADLSLHDLAQIAQLDEYRFSRWFKKSTGLPPHQYVLRERTELAKSLLRNPALPLAEVALRCGFGDQSHFSNTFHRMTTISPGAYRKAV
jgi:AraC family transcriptional regulator